MARYKRESRGKTINPTFFIFCEGESEESYIRHLRAKYRIPVEIVPKITRNQVNERKIKEYLNTMPQHEKDRIFLMYDIDVAGFLEKLQTIQKGRGWILLTSNPCFELWYILHYGNQTSEISSGDCIRKIESICHNYQKGYLPQKMKDKLEEKKCEAIIRAKGLISLKNPSTNIYTLIEELEKVKK